ncbi:hypothetical protein MAPG_04433 [Magnaporthiopsis poae ATCC 64411]|uniref:Histidine kinase group protein n=1 Tax=Magnaporthiopsis poae (strain ATCC 64411 / 73-15) TaxID=644358 RepID=A0A0C4DWQ3_MAGP6|nr:hypothetical protein MAPG_04433 [Magnaporthiopsis poae ATCC 64411]
MPGPAEKKKKGAGEGEGSSAAAPDAPAPSRAVAKGPGSRPAAGTEGVPLIICRNKHWRYISSFHGPWLNLPLETLESLAHSNYNSPRPKPIEVGIFFDLVKIRKLVGEATPLTVNAANGLGPGKMKLSQERKHRMRDQATKRLSQAYHIDEIATSVAIMQGTTSLENVAEHVLDKKRDDLDAKYVHFFHEKIPSRHVVESTPFDPLNDIIAARPMGPEPFRTRAVLRAFAEDYEGAVADLTAAMQLLRYNGPAHTARDDAGGAPPLTPTGRRPPELRLSDDEQPTSLELQLVFQRGSAYLSRACQCVYSALPTPPEKSETGSSAAAASGQASPTAARDEAATQNADENAAPEPAVEFTSKQIAARKSVKAKAKRALKDFTNFLDHLEYSPEYPLEDYEEFSRKHRAATRYHSPNVAPAATYNTHKLYKLSTLFEATPPAGLPPYPPTADQPRQDHAQQQQEQSQEPQQRQQQQQQQQRQQQEQQQSQQQQQQQQLAPSSAPENTTTTVLPVESVTYHPLLTDAMHSVLLCHILLGTNMKELQRHAYMVARLTRVADGYPIFQSSRSPARADWIEILKRFKAEHWLPLRRVWEVGCRPAQLIVGIPPKDPPPSPSATRPQSTDGSNPSLAPTSPYPSRVSRPPSSPYDSRAGDPTANSPARTTSVTISAAPGGRRWDGLDENTREYPIWTERAPSILRWLRESPSLPPLPPNRGGRKKKKAVK